ncbi:hypothetical protein ABZ442_17585 [Streptomyces triculaminicus]|uniref:hypothetical protein n=1 Tax=Streptomyces triculaminicus TaxID=2816232 RepID=UPI0033D27467
MRSSNSTPAVRARRGPPSRGLDESPFRTATLRTVTVDLSGELITDAESEIRMRLARQ